MIPLPRDFGEFLRLLSRHRVRYLVVGGYAVAYHGYPRYTGDIDIYVALSPRNAEGLVKVFRDFGFAENGPQAAAFTERGQIVRIGREPMRLEVLNEIDGVSPCARINVYEMRKNPAYFPLRGDPRFEALLNDPKNNAPLF